MGPSRASTSFARSGRSPCRRSARARTRRPSRKLACSRSRQRRTPGRRRTRWSPDRRPRRRSSWAGRGGRCPSTVTHRDASTSRPRHWGIQRSCDTPCQTPGVPSRAVAARRTNRPHRRAFRRSPRSQSTRPPLRRRSRPRLPCRRSHRRRSAQALRPSSRPRMPRAAQRPWRARAPDERGDRARVREPPQLQSEAPTIKRETRTPSSSKSGRPHAMLPLHVPADS